MTSGCHFLQPPRFLVQALADLLQLPEPPEEIITDPYFSMIVGEALARTELPARPLDRLRKDAPWALFEAIRQVGEPSKEHHDRFFDEARTWAGNESQSIPESVLSAICWTLVETDSSRALAIIGAMTPNPLLLAAGLRNGSATHGMRFVRAVIRHDFEPGGGDRLRDKILEHARHRHGEQIAREIRAQLSRPDLVALDVNAYLALLGHFGFPGFDELIRDVWGRVHDVVLWYAIWAAAR